VALVWLHWTPAAFWAATPHELHAAFEVLKGDHKRDDFTRFKREVEQGV
jgi:hypothetical protein